MGRNIQLLRQNLPVTRRLIEHIDVVGVFQNVFDLLGCQQVFHILRQSGGNTAPFPEPFPDLHRIIGSLFLFEQ